MGGFQAQINDQPAPAEAGDFFGVNPRASLIGGPGMYSAPEGGLIVGRFAWVDLVTGDVSQHFVAGRQLGFLHRENNAVITAFLGEATYVVNEGLPLALFDQGDFWGLFADGAQPGDLVWADPGNGALSAGAVAPELDSYTLDAGFGGTAQQGAAFTVAVATNVATISALSGWIDEGSVVTSANIAGVALGARLTGVVGGVGTFTFVHADVAAEAGTAANDVVSVSAVAQGALQVGSVIDSSGADVSVVAFMSGTGGVGTYEVSASQRVASGAVTAETDVINVSAVTTGPIEVGDTVVSASVAADTHIVAQLTGTPGGVGTYRTNTLNYFTSEAAVSEAVATPWIVNSPADAGELAKISTWG